MADEGAIFTNYFVNGNWTRPSTASLLTGLLPGEHHLEQEPDKLVDSIATLPEVLRNAGVPTGAVIGNGNAGSAFGLQRGFDFYADTVKHWRGLPNAQQVVDLALPFVRQHRNEPFFFLLFLVDLHDPYHAPAPYETMFTSAAQGRLIRSPHWEAKSYNANTIARMQGTYDGALRYTDDVLGQFFATLKQENIYDKATIVVTADHGEAFGEHGVYLHGHHLFDEILRAPLIVRAPVMSRRGVAVRRLAQSIDIMPTLTTYYDVSARDAGMQAPLKGVPLFAAPRRPGRTALWSAPSITLASTVGRRVPPPISLFFRRRPMPRSLLPA